MLARRSRRSKVAQLAFAALLVLIVPAQGTASFGRLGRGTSDIEGQLLMLHADDFRHGHETDTEALRTDRGALVKLDLSQVGDYPIALAGKRVHLTGEHRGDVFVATDAALVSGSSATQTATSGTSTAAANTTTPTTHKTAVILLNFTNDQRQPWTPSQVADVMFGSTNSVNAYYEESSYGNVSFTGTVFGWVTVPYDNSGCDSWDWGQAAQLALGINPNDYTNIVYIWPQASTCFWAGMANIGGQYSWINGYLTIRVLAHELGHNIGVQHAGSLECSENGVRVTISAPSNCYRDEYGDPYSVMGSGTRGWTDFNRGQAGWISEMTTITRSGSYTIAPEELGNPTRLFRVARSDGTYFYFEFRQPYGTFDNFDPSDPAVNGVLVRLGPDKTTVSQTALLDATPLTDPYNDAAFQVGQSFTDPVSGVSVTTTAVNPAGATISVSFGGGGSTGGDTSAPSLPGNLTATPGTSTVALSWTASTDNLGVAGYQVFRNGVLLATTTGTGYTDSGLAAQTTYGYQVKAYDAAGNTSAAASVSATTTGDTTAPKTPSNLKAPVIGTTQVALYWTPSTDNVGVTAYEVYRDGVEIGETPLPNWLDSGLVAGSSHKYQVLARDAAGNRSALSSALSVRLVSLSTSTTGTVAGVAYDANGRPLANAVVQLTGNALSKSAKTGTSGTYKFSSLPVGTYTVTITPPTTTSAAAATTADTLSASVAPGVTLVLVAPA